MSENTARRSRGTVVSGVTAAPLWRLVSIILLYVLVHIQIIATTVCASRDGARYLTFALRLETEPYVDVLRSSDDHPGYPFLLRTAFATVKQVGLDSPHDQVVVAQVVTALCGLIVVLLSYRIMLRVWSPLVSWAATVAFVLLPYPARNASDIASDPLFVAFALSAILLVTQGFRSGELWRFLLAGVFAGLAYTVRVDALIVPVVVVVALVIGGLSRDLRQPLGVARRAAAGCMFLCPVTLSLALFLGFYGKLSPKPAYKVMLGLFYPDATQVGPDMLRRYGPTRFGVDAGAVVLRPDFVLEDSSTRLPPARDHLRSRTPIRIGSTSVATILPAGEPGFLRGIWRYVEKVGRLVQYVHMYTCALGIGLLVYYRRRFTSAGVLFLVAIVLYGLTAVRLQQKAGYVSGRYFLSLVPFVVGFGMYSMENLGQLVADKLGREKTRKPGHWKRRMVLLALAGSLACSLPSLVKRTLHEGSYGLIAAGEWIAANVTAGDTVFDPYFYPTFLTALRDRTTATIIPEELPGHHYVIVDEKDWLTRKALAERLRNADGVRAESFPSRQGGKVSTVHVYRFAGRPRSDAVGQKAQR